MSHDGCRMAFLAEGKLWIKSGALAPQLIESTFAQQQSARVAKEIERHGWRQRDSEMGPFGGRLLWGKAGRVAHVRKCQITGLSRTPQANSVLYALDTGAVGGLFTYDLQEKYENRLFHKQEFRGNDLSHHPVKEVVALSLQLEDGTASIAIMQPGGRGLRAITEGDSLDQAPAWVPTPEDGGREVLVYQSAGIGRSANGLISGLGPYSIHRLDLDKGEMTTLLEDGRWDYLVPRVRIEERKEVLYFIRRPYKAEGQGRMTPLRLLGDIALFPFRLARAVFAFLNVMSLMFAHKPLTTAGGPKTDPYDTTLMQLHGRWIDAKKVQAAATSGQPVALVPASWELMKMDSAGKVTSLAKHVLAFDIGGDGTIAYTNGSEIFVVPVGAEAERVCAHRMIQQVMVLG
jgi:hypothetical protein